eukprot:14012326-Alexandrium_andersonii.AAC.1
MGCPRHPARLSVRGSRATAPWSSSGSPARERQHAVEPARAETARHRSTPAAAARSPAAGFGQCQ